MEDADFAAFERGADGLGGVNPPPPGLEHMVVRAGDPPARPEHLIVRPGDPPARAVLLGAHGGSAPSQARQPEGSPSSRDAWAEHDDFPTFERDAERLLWSDGPTEAERALGGSSGSKGDSLVVRGGGRAVAQPVLYQVRQTAPDRPAPQVDLHTPKTPQFRFDQAKAAFLANKTGDPKAFIPLFDKYPGARYDFADGVNEALGAKRNVQGQLVGGVGMSRQATADVVMKALAGSSLAEAAAFKRLNGADPKYTPADARAAAALVRRTSGEQGESIAQGFEALANEREQRAGGRR